MLPFKPWSLPLAAVAGLVALGAAQAAPMPIVDHHMHIFSPEASRVLKLICARVGPVKCPPEISKDASTGADVIAALDAAGIQRGVLLSTAYFFSSPDVADLKLDIPRETRAENQFVVDQAHNQCRRLSVFVSVNPLAPGAVAEVRYWAHRGGVAGLKLHLSNSGFDFRSPEEVKKLAAVFRAAQRAHMAMVIHLQTRREDYDGRDVAIFLRDVLPEAPTVPIQIAHAAGGGGVDKGELSALAAFADAFDQHPAATQHIFFDLAMVPDEVANTAKIAATPAKVDALKALIQRIGLKRFVLGSDWTSGLDLKHYYDDERQALALSDAEWAALAGQMAPYMKTAGAGCPIGR